MVYGVGRITLSFRSIHMSQLGSVQIGAKERNCVLRENGAESGGGGGEGESGRGERMK